jgi:septation ring formation regulator EzrA
MASIEWPEGMDERMRALVSLDIQRNAILLSAIESSVQTVREDVQQAQAANMKMFNAMRDDLTDLRKDVKVVDQKVTVMDQKITGLDRKLDLVLSKFD